ncbi:DeoR/GlpR family DNA-binding transcription regulator [Cetobacterium somerae]|uniref:DeoR/GlpR family DNA-binding transcription regulator n=1 Tax=Cetobacterium somerae TaxID=188913 RepID=UPI003D768EE4
MFVEERKQRILNILKQKEKVSVNELSNLFSVSKVIIRKDLCQMEEENLLTRTHGGAIFKKKIVNKSILKDINKDEFEKITFLAEKILNVIEENETIFLDESKISILAAALLQKKKIKISVISNSLEIQKILSENKDIQIISLGGVYDSKSNSFIGEIARDNLELFNIDKTFISVGGVNIDRMFLSTHNIDNGKFKNTAIKMGSKNYIIAESKQFFQDSIFNFSQLKPQMNIITDESLSKEIYNKLIEQQINVIK